MVSLLSALFLFSLSVHCLVSCLAANKKNITTDEYALLAFKSLITSYPNHILANNWSTSSSVCNWVGVTCDEKHNRVHTLNLTNMGHRGTISPSLGNLSFLVILDLSYNNFSGQFPFKEICWLRRLKSLRVIHNKFFGEIPPTLGNLSQLQILNLGENNFSGLIPQSIGNLRGLKMLYLDNNGLSGPIPQSISNMSMLEKLFLYSNYFSADLAVLAPAVMFSSGCGCFRREYGGLCGPGSTLVRFDGWWWRLEAARFGCSRWSFYFDNVIDGEEMVLR
ncbi:non-specific serine/threonine protein kinase [Trifolium repens]|nr:non-specific serine/threonine protein kinase [Trifolium repens]